MANTTLKIAIRDFPKLAHERLMRAATAVRAHEAKPQPMEPQISMAAVAAAAALRQRTMDASRAAESEVKTELRKLGLASYAARFVEDGYDDWSSILRMSDATIDALVR